MSDGVGKRQCEWSKFNVQLLQGRRFCKYLVRPAAYRAPYTTIYSTDGGRFDYAAWRWRFPASGDLFYGETRGTKFVNYFFALSIFILVLSASLHSGILFIWHPLQKGSLAAYIMARGGFLLDTFRDLPLHRPF